ncbi:MAG: hypothetical protein QXY49_04055 [Thermofilaceae archaeon]
MSRESEKPSKVLVFLVSIPALLLILIWFLTEGFKVQPSLPHLFSRIVPLALAVVASVIALLAYGTAKDEEPEWEETFIFKIIEGVALVYIVLAALFSAIIVFTYFIT